MLTPMRIQQKTNSNKNEDCVADANENPVSCIPKSTISSTKPQRAQLKTELKRNSNKHLLLPSPRKPDVLNPYELNRKKSTLIFGLKSKKSEEELVGIGSSGDVACVVDAFNCISPTFATEDLHEESQGDGCNKTNTILCDEEENESSDDVEDRVYSIRRFQIVGNQQESSDNLMDERAKKTAHFATLNHNQTNRASNLQQF